MKAIPYLKHQEYYYGGGSTAVSRDAARYRALRLKLGESLDQEADDLVYSALVEMMQEACGADNPITRGGNKG